MLCCSQRGLLKRPLRLLLPTKLMRALAQPPGPPSGPAQSGEGQRGPRAHVPPRTPSAAPEGPQQSQDGRKEPWGRLTWGLAPALFLDGLAPGWCSGPQSPRLSVGRESVCRSDGVLVLSGPDLEGVSVVQLRSRVTPLSGRACGLEWGQLGPGRCGAELCPHSLGPLSPVSLCPPAPAPPHGPLVPCSFHSHSPRKPTGSLHELPFRLWAAVYPGRGGGGAGGLRMASSLRMASALQRAPCNHFSA